MNKKFEIKAYSVLLYAKRIALGLSLALILFGFVVFMSSKMISPKDIEVTEVVGYMISFHPRESRYGTSFSIQVKIENGAKSSFRSDQVGVFQEGGAVLLRQFKNLKTGEVSHTFLQAN